MFARIAVVAAALAAAPSAFAADSTVADLSRDTGVSERHIRMVVGARTPYPEYRVVFNRVERQLKSALGQDGFERLLDGDIAAAAEIRRARLAEEAAVAAKAGPPAAAPQRQDG
ncbi:hypothetical protein [Pseudoxanthomonas sp. 10H]|uniref:hypothetical protein n=1 Tax=Pseudoxanthomonas sp. 10H TaxID=3242729 RepID=UPI003556243B